jgi:hypothetical protein
MQESQVEASSPHGQREPPDDLEHRISPNSQSPDAGVRVSIYESMLSESADRSSQRQNTVTIEEIQESDAHASDAGTGADRPGSSPENAVIQLPGVEPTPKRDNKLEKRSDAMVVERGTGPETPTTTMTDRFGADTISHSAMFSRDGQ